jgi:hypothetical protein
MKSGSGRKKKGSEKTDSDLVEGSPGRIRKFAGMDTSVPTRLEEPSVSARKRKSSF